MYEIGPEIDPLFAFVLILIVGFTIPEVIRRLNVTYVPFYIVAGIILGAFVTPLQNHPAFAFIADIGLFMLIFIAGLEIHETRIKALGKTLTLSIISAGVCFIGGTLLGLFLGYPTITSILLGTIMMSSSVGEIIPMIQSSSFLREKFGNFMLPAIIIMDGASLFILAFIIQLGRDLASYVIFIIGSILLLFLIFYALPKIARKFFSLMRRKPAETDLRFVLTVLLATVAIGGLIHLHGIVISFLVGLALGEFIDEKTYSKLHAFGYGFFIPIFFIVLGMDMDIGVLSNIGSIVIMLLIIGTLITCKIIGATIFAKKEGFTTRDGVVMGATLWPQLSATLAAAVIGLKYGIIDQQLFVSVMVMAIFTAISAPFVVRMLIKEEERKKALTRHVVIIGYGRNSKLITDMLKIEKKEFVVVESNISVVEELKGEGIEAIYGDGADRKVLHNAGIEEAKTAIVTIPDEHEEYLSLKKIREINPECYTIAVVHTMQQYRRLKDEKLTDHTIWPEKLASTEIVDHFRIFREEET